MNCFIFPSKKSSSSSFVQVFPSPLKDEMVDIPPSKSNQIIFIPVHLPNQPGVHRLSAGLLKNTAKLAVGILFSPQFLYRMTEKIFSHFCPSLLVMFWAPRALFVTTEFDLRLQTNAHRSFSRGKGSNLLDKRVACPDLSIELLESDRNPSDG